MAIEETKTRGRSQVRAFAGAMVHQLDANEGKGGWKDRPTDVCVWQIVYHSVKLFLQAIADEVDPIAVQEFAADVGNEAMILADSLGTLEKVFESDNACLLSDDRAMQLTTELVEVLVRHGVLPEGFEAPSVESEAAD